MMAGYISIKLLDLIDEEHGIGEKSTKELLSHFYCPLNADVEKFLKSKAIEFAKQGIATTYIVLAKYKEKNVLVGYYTIASKIIVIYKSSLQSNSFEKRIRKFSNYDPNLKRYEMPAPLIAQLGKNYDSNYNKLITGDELLKLAIDRISNTVFSGKYTYIECEDNDRLMCFYESNGFVNFGKRKLEKGETDIKGEYLVQMLRSF